MFIKNFILFIFVVANCECYQNNLGVKGRTGHAIKSYGGYSIPNTGAYKENSDTVPATTNYYRTVTPAPYGWNFNYNQPSRTYGKFFFKYFLTFNRGVNYLQTPRFGNSYGWTVPNAWNSQSNRFGSSSSIPQLPQYSNLYQPNFVPPVFYPETFSYPSYNNFGNLFPTYPNYVFNQRPVVPTDGNVVAQQPGLINSGGVVSSVPAISNQGGILSTGTDSAGSATQGTLGRRPTVLNQGENFPNLAGTGTNTGSGTTGGGSLSNRPAVLNQGEIFSSPTGTGSGIATQGSSGGQNLGSRPAVSNQGGILSTGTGIGSGISGTSTGGSTGSNLGNSGGSTSSNVAGGGFSSNTGGSSLGGGSTSTTGQTGGSSTTFGSGNFDSVQSASNPSGIYTFYQNPFYQEPQRPLRPQRPINNQYIPPYPQQPTHPLPDQNAFESNNQQTIVENKRPTEFFNYPQQTARPLPYPQQPTRPLPDIQQTIQPLPDQNAFESNNFENKKPIEIPTYSQQTARPLTDQSAFESNNQEKIVENKKPTDFTRFPSTSLLSENRRSEWTADDEMKWQATTKAPYFENKAPVLGCTLPAASIIHAMSVFKLSTLLPLDVPSGKPILSCNATDLLQAQINLNGKIYDCKNTSISVSCDECRSETLECDVNMRQMDENSVTCTNGTLVSNSQIICDSATLMAGKNILNCFYKNAPRVSTTERPVFVIPLPTPAPVNEVFNENSLEDRAELTEDESQLLPQVKRAMDKVFPHELLALPSIMYLPQKQALQPQISDDLKKHVDDVFDVDLLASSHDKQENDSEKESPRLSTKTDTSEKFSENLRNQTQSRWDASTNIKNATNETKTKTTTRFGGETTQHDDDRHDRLIFTN